MKKVIAATVVGAFLLSTPLVYASDKASSDSAVKEPAKTEAAPLVKMPPAAKSSTPATVKEHGAVKAVPPVQEKTVKEQADKPAKTPAGQAAPEAGSVKVKAKHVKKSQPVKPLETSSLGVSTGHSAKSAAN